MKKSNFKLVVILILCVAVLAAMLGLLYVWYTTAEKRKDDVVEEKEKRAVEQAHNVNCTGYVVMKKDAPLYQKSNDAFQQVGMVSKGSLVLLSEQNKKQQSHYQIADSEYYIYFGDIKRNDENRKYDTSYQRYIAFNENIKTNLVSKLYDQNGQLRYVFKGAIDLPIIQKQGDMYFVVFMNELLAVKKSEVSVYEHANSQVSNAKQIPVLMYHFFYDAKANEQAPDSNYVEIQNFRAQMQYTKDNGYQSITMKELDMYLDGMIQLPAKSFVVSIDDNAESLKRLAYPVLEELKVYATNFVITSWSEDFASLQSSYVELQSHSDAMHQGGCSGMQHGGLFNCISYQDGYKDVTTSKDKLNGAFVFCYPFGDVNDNMKKVLHDAGYRLAFTTKFGYVTLGMDKLQLPRVRITKNTSMQAFASLLEG